MTVKYIVGANCLGGDKPVYLKIVVEFISFDFMDQSYDSGFDTLLNQLNLGFQRKFGNVVIDESPELESETDLPADLFISELD